MQWNVIPLKSDKLLENNGTMKSKTDIVKTYCREKEKEEIKKTGKSLSR